MDIYIKVAETPAQKEIREAKEETERIRLENEQYIEALKILGVNV